MAQLNKALQIIEDYCDLYCLIVNTDKSKALDVTKK